MLKKIVEKNEMKESIEGIWKEIVTILEVEEDKLLSIIHKLEYLRRNISQQIPFPSDEQLSSTLQRIRDLKSHIYCSYLLPS